MCQHSTNKPHTCLFNIYTFFFLSFIYVSSVFLCTHKWNLNKKNTQRDTNVWEKNVRVRNQLWRTWILFFFRPLEISCRIYWHSIVMRCYFFFHTCFLRKMCIAFSIIWQTRLNTCVCMVWLSGCYCASQYLCFIVMWAYRFFFFRFFIHIGVAVWKYAWK